VFSSPRSDAQLVTGSLVLHHRGRVPGGTRDVLRCGRGRSCAPELTDNGHRRPGQCLVGGQLAVQAGILTRVNPGPDRDGLVGEDDGSVGGVAPQPPRELPGVWHKVRKDEHFPRCLLSACED